MPDCTELWNEVDRQSALVDQAGEAYEQAATSLMFYTEQLVAAIEAAMACETGQNLNTTEAVKLLMRAVKTMAAHSKKKR